MHTPTPTDDPGRRHLPNLEYLAGMLLLLTLLLLGRLVEPAGPSPVETNVEVAPIAGR
jgi:hypothetical protein